MDTPNDNRVKEALKILEEEGRKHYKPEYQETVPAFESIGLAIASVTDNCDDILRLAYAFLEDWNRHDICSVIEWINPLFGQPYYDLDLQRIKRQMEKRGVTILTEWDTEKKDYKSKVVNVSLVVKDVKTKDK